MPLHFVLAYSYFIRCLFSFSFLIISTPNAFFNLTYGFQRHDISSSDVRLDMAAAIRWGHCDQLYLVPFPPLALSASKPRRVFYLSLRSLKYISFLPWLQRYNKYLKLDNHWVLLLWKIISYAVLSGKYRFRGDELRIEICTQTSRKSVNPHFSISLRPIRFMSNFLSSCRLSAPG